MKPQQGFESPSSSGRKRVESIDQFAEARPPDLGGNAKPAQGVGEGEGVVVVLEGEIHDESAGLDVVA